jgi:hypothetical protein
MIIEVKKDVFWDTEAQVQSDAAREWLNTDIYPQTDNTTPTLDEFKRPVLWVIPTDTCTVNIHRIYTTQSSSWAMDRDTIVVTANTKNNGN